MECGSLFYEQLIQHFPAGVLVLDETGSVLVLNDRAAAVLQVSQEEVVGKRLDTLSLSRERLALREVAAICERLREGGEQAGGAVVLRNRDGALESYQMHGVRFLQENKYSHILILITEQIPGSVTGYGRVAAHTTARLAGALAHEIRNPLSSIKSAAQYLRRHRTDDTALLEFLDIILEEVDVMNRVTTDFLEFSQKGLPTASYVNRIDVVLQRTLRLVGPTFADRQIRVIQDLDPNISEVIMESTQLEQILRNIILNAIEAMPHGGTLTIITRQELSSRQPEVRISIQDTGAGIPAAQLEKIFERSYTTKKQGAGLGLSIVREIVDNHGGRIQVTSEQGKGTVFSLHLPATETFARSAT